MAKGEGFIQNTMTILNGSDVSDAVRIPRNCSVVTFFQPVALAVQGPVTAPIGSTPYVGYAHDETGTWKVQSMVPTSGNSADDITWVDGTYWSPEGNAVRSLVFPFAANTALSFQSWMLGGGQIRINAGAIQPADTVFVVFFSGFNN